MSGKPLFPRMGSSVADADMLRRMWAEQFSFLVEATADIDRLSLSDKIARTKDMIIHAQTELVELLNEVPWKSWLGRRAQEPDIDGVTEEAVDVVKFVMNVLLVWGVSADQFFEAFERKSEVNLHRHFQHVQLSKIMSLWRRNAGNFKVAALDLDGVLAAYPEHWLGFLEAKESAPSGEFKVEDFSLLSGLLSHDLNRETYSKWKHEYRASGQEAEVPPLPGAAQFTRQLRGLGYHIVIISARPVARYKRIYSDTIRWLKRHEFSYDAVLWDENKEDRIIRELPIVDFVLEDDPINAIKLKNAKIPVYLLRRPYNQPSSTGTRVKVYDDGGEFAIVDGYDDLLKRLTEEDPRR